MDDSLDNYISKTNFKVKVGNPRFKGNSGHNPNSGGFQGKRKFGGYQTNKVTDVSITVPAVRKTAINKNSTNQIRDARDRLVGKSKPLDARTKLNQKAARNTDARQKLMTIRAQKEPVDARAKIQAKKQLQATTGTTSKQGGPFTLTRTVANNGGGSNIQMTAGVQGNVSITKTLTKVMPPGYDAVLGASTISVTSKPQNPKQTTGVMKRLGTPAGPRTNTTVSPRTKITTAGPNTNIPNITRTISNPHKPTQHPGNPEYGTYVPAVHQLPYPPAPNQTPGAPFQQQQQSMYTQPTPANIPPYPIESPQQHPPPVPTHYSPPAPPAQSTLPYPPQEPIIRQEFPDRGQMIPRIEVQNDQYRPPEPHYQQYTSPPQPQYAPPPQQYLYTQPPQQTYYQPPAQESYISPQEAYPPRQETYRSPPQSTSSGSVFVKTIKNDALPPRHTATESSPLKRKSYGSTSESSGPLRSSTINYIPVIETTGASSRTQKPVPAKLTKITPPGAAAEPAIKRLKNDGDEENVISPLQGYKVAITNLATSVTQDDIIELFGAVGAVKSVKVVKNGTAEVVYVKKDSALEATKTYHDRELDGLPMIVKMVTPVSARIREAPEKLPPTMKPAATGPLEFSKKTATKPRSSQKEDVDVTTLHKALFKTGAPGPSKPVTFTVNI